MKKAVAKKMLSVFLAAATMLGVIGCGNSTEPTGEKTSEVATSTSKSSSAEAEVEESGVVFPLEEEVTINLMIAGDGDQEELLEKCTFWQELYEATNVKVELTILSAEEPLQTLNAMFSAGIEGDAIMSHFITESDLSVMAANNLLMPMNEYIEDADIMPNFNERVLSESPGTKGVITAPDGNIYALPRYIALEGSYLESPIWINKAWIDQLGMEIPTTLEELKEVLVAFRDNDMNGNGKTDDEIPYLVLNGSGFSHFEAFLGLYGIPTKDSTFENYVFIEDGQVQFAPTKQAYKDAITTLNDWYEDGLIWSECFTGNIDTYSAKLSGAEPVVGMFTSKTPPTTNSEDYVQLLPVSVDGYETRWYLHPGLMGTKGLFCLTRSCENPEIVMKWIDMFYSFESGISVMYGEEGGRYEMVDGKFNALELDAETKETLAKDSPTLVQVISLVPYAYTSEDYAERMMLTKDDEAMQQNYELYKDYLNDEIWPRPYLSEEVTIRLSELRTDIFNTVATKKAAWITGTSDIDAEWDAFVESLNKMGIDEFVELMQGAYDDYVEAQK